MDPTPVQTLLALRRREEDDARAASMAARAELAAAETEAERLDQAVADARARLEEARRRQLPPASNVSTRRSAASADLEARFLTRLRDAVERAAQRAGAHRARTLAGARDRDRAAGAAYDERRRAREAAERHEAALAIEREREAERRAEDARDDMARAARHARTGRS